jgi:hypothetical protein
LSVHSLRRSEILANATTRKAWWLHYLLSHRRTTHWMLHCYALWGSPNTHMPWYLFFKMNDSIHIWVSVVTFLFWRVLYVILFQWTFWVFGIELPFF